MRVKWVYSESHNSHLASLNLKSLRKKKKVQINQELNIKQINYLQLYIKSNNKERKTKQYKKYVGTICRQSGAYLSV